MKSLANSKTLLTATACLGLLPLFILADTHYVWTNSPSPTPPYSDWPSAAHDIQSAIDAASSDDTVLVTNGVYATGGRAVYGSMTNRVVIDKPVVVRSVNGPEETIIKGNGPLGNGAVRCVYVGTNAILAGFTLTNGYTRSSGDFAKEESGGGAWCETSGCLSNCVLSGNSAYTYGGGTYYGTLNNCLLNGNSANYGGGTYYGTLNNCILNGNSANGGGGASYGTLNNCSLSGNSATHYGGGTFFGTLGNCTFYNNWAVEGGGAFGSTLNNCILYHNSACLGPNHYGGSLSYCYTTPDPGGTGNITNSPGLVSPGHIAVNSPCVGSGSTAYASGVDIDGDSWQIPPSMGCDEPMAGSQTGPLTVVIVPQTQTAATCSAVCFTGQIEGRCTSNSWSFGDGSALANDIYASHAWSTTGDWAVVLKAFNQSCPDGAAATVTVHIVAAETTARYVWTNSPTPAFPYDDWSNAAHTIQEAIDAQTLFGGWVVVTDGVYAAGTRVTPGCSLSNRVVITNNILVKSVNGPAVTSICGRGPLGTEAVRCVFMTNGVLQGFTLTNGFTQTYSPSAQNNDYYGGGAYAPNATLNNCVLAGNSASFDGGGVAYGTLNNCILIGNSATSGGGAYGSTLNNCLLTDNFASYVGGGASCGALRNCTLMGNIAYQSGGGICFGEMHNCISYHNSAAQGANYGTYRSGCSEKIILDYCCTTPDPGGTGNITNEPQFGSLGHIAPGSPCAQSGSSAYALGTDVDGEPWQSPPSMGCDEPTAGSQTGTLSVVIVPQTHTAATYSAVCFTGQIEGRCASNSWSFGDGSALANDIYASHAWTTTGDWPVVLKAFNQSCPYGVAATVAVHVVDAESTARYAWTNSPTPAFPYDNWSNAAHTIQEAIDAQTLFGGWVVVTDGVYSAGIRGTPGCSLSNRVVITNNILVKSVNGAAVTIIKGQTPAGNSAVRCVFITNGTIEGFTLTNGATQRLPMLSSYDTGGGGAFALGGTLNNCALTGNSAEDYGAGAMYGLLNNCTLIGNSMAIQNSGNGGGAYCSILNNCVITRNSASQGGGGYGGTMNNCAVSGNYAPIAWGGGTYYVTLNNCIVYYNTGWKSNNMYGGSATFTCTTPDPGGTGNITNEPLFVATNAANYRLQAGSPCINAGNNADVQGDLDFDGNPRIQQGLVDMGAYEFYQSAGVPATWQTQYELPTNGCMDYWDSDCDGLFNCEEYIAGTVPTDSNSVLRLVEIGSDYAGSNAVIAWQSVTGKLYTVERSCSLLDTPPFTNLESEISGQAGTTIYTDRTSSAGCSHYRVKVE